MGREPDGSDTFQQIIRYAKTDAQTPEIEIVGLHMLRYKDRQSQHPRNEERLGRHRQRDKTDRTDTNGRVRDESQRNRKGD
jgi:hypothetical protein